MGAQYASDGDAQDISNEECSLRDALALADRSSGAFAKLGAAFAVGKPPTRKRMIPVSGTHVPVACPITPAIPRMTPGPHPDNSRIPAEHVDHSRIAADMTQVTPGSHWSCNGRSHWGTGGSVERRRQHPGDSGIAPIHAPNFL
jgi:hypothetical protein